MDYLYLIISLCCGLIIGIWGTTGYWKRVFNNAYVGNLNFDHSIPDEVNPINEFLFDLNTIEKKGFIIMKVTSTNYISSQKENQEHGK